MHDLLVKTHPADREKIELTRRLVSEHLDIDKVLDTFADPVHSRTSTRAERHSRRVRGPAVRSVGSALAG